MTPKGHATYKKDNYEGKSLLFDKYSIQIEKVSPEKTIKQIAISAYKITFSVLGSGI